MNTTPEGVFPKIHFFITYDWAQKARLFVFGEPFKRSAIGPIDKLWKQ